MQTDELKKKWVDGWVDFKKALKQETSPAGAGAASSATRAATLSHGPPSAKSSPWSLWSAPHEPCEGGMVKG